MHGSEPELDLVEELLLVALVLVVEERLAVLPNLPRLSVGVFVEDVARLEESSVHEVIEAREPTSEVLIVLDIGVDLVQGVLHALHGLAIGESLEEGSELVGGR